MAAIEIISQDQSIKFSKPFRVDAGKVVVISSYNFCKPLQDEVGGVTRQGDCAILHKIDLCGDVLPQLQAGCSCILDGLDIYVLSSEPVLQGGLPWSHNYENNLTVLSVPGYYMFELCNCDSIGNVVMTVEELDVSNASIIPRQLFHGDC